MNEIMENNMIWLYASVILTSFVVFHVFSQSAYIPHAWKNLDDGKLKPNPRTAANAVFDTNRGHLYLIGGSYNSIVEGKPDEEIWRYDTITASWLSITPPSPVPSRFHTSVLDSKRDVIYVFGGFTTGSSNAFWAFDLTAQQWHLKRSGVNEGSGYDGGQYSERGVKDPLNYPAARTDHAMTLDEETGNIYICCGTLSQESGFIGDFWEWDAREDVWILWSGGNPHQTTEYSHYGNLSEASISSFPGARWRTSMTMNSQTGLLYLFGGNGYGELAAGDLNDLWEWNRNTKMWRWIGGSNVVDSPGNTGMLGAAGSQFLPSSRFSHALHYSPNFNVLVLYGGSHAGIASGDLWTYSLETAKWTCWGLWRNNAPRLTPNHALLDKILPPPAFEPAVTLNKLTGELYVTGGEDPIEQKLVQGFWHFTPPKCLPGFQLNSDMTNCQPCFTGFYQPLISSKPCLACPQFAICNATAYKCQPGFSDERNGTCFLIPLTIHPLLPKEHLTWWQSSPGTAMILLCLIWSCLLLFSFTLGFLYRDIIRHSKPLSNSTTMTTCSTMATTSQSFSNTSTTVTSVDTKLAVPGQAAIISFTDSATLQWPDDSQIAT